MTKAIEIHVTAAHIASGARTHEALRPIALAVREHLATDDVWVTLTWIRAQGRQYAIPASAFAFIWSFDHALPVEPFTFVLEEQPPC